MADQAWTEVHLDRSSLDCELYFQRDHLKMDDRLVSSLVIVLNQTEDLL